MIVKKGRTAAAAVRAVCGIGAVLIAQQAQAACSGRFKASNAPLTFNVQNTPRSGQPYSLNTWAEPFLPQKAECGTWAIRTFVLYARRYTGHGSADHPVGRAVINPANGQLRAGYSTGDGDLLIVPVLLLAQPSRNAEDLADSRAWDLEVADRQQFQNLKFALRDPGLKNRWKFQPVSGAVDDGGTHVIVNFVVSCGEATCTTGELAEAAVLAEAAERLFRSRRGDLAAALQAPQDPQ
jgi:hypothetical protein